jgi:hypothetical protein
MVNPRFIARMKRRTAIITVTIAPIIQPYSGTVERYCL